MFLIDSTLIDWSRAQFALTAMYHWLFVPLTLGLGVIMSVAETKYYRSGEAFWKETAKFWQKIFGINFAIGVATGIILEFQFGTNWSNYSWFVGDIFGAPLAIEGILAFFMEATFIAVMFFGWDKVSKRFHLASTWLTLLGASLSAWWILVANAWMQHPVGMTFNPDTVRNEMTDFMAVAFSPVAVAKFFHTVISSWIVGAVVAIGISSWYLLKRRQKRFALESIRISSWIGLVATIVTIFTGDLSAYQIASHQPMKLAAMENLYDGQKGAPLSLIGLVNPSTEYGDEARNSAPPFIFNLEVPKVLSIMATRELDGYVPGINDLMRGYTKEDGTEVLSAEEKIRRGQIAIEALATYRQQEDKNSPSALSALATLRENYDYFGYGYVKDPSSLVPNVMILYYSFRVMVGLSMAFLCLFLWAIWMGRKRSEGLWDQKWFHYAAILAVPLVYICSQAGWVVAEMGRQPWLIQDILPRQASISKIATGSVQVTFFLFLILFTALLIAELSIMFKAIKQGPNLDDSTGTPRDVKE